MHLMGHIFQVRSCGKSNNICRNTHTRKSGNNTYTKDLPIRHEEQTLEVTLATNQLERCHELARRVLEDKQKLSQLYRPVFVILNNDFLEHRQSREGFLPCPLVVSLEGYSFYTRTPSQNPKTRLRCCAEDPPCAEFVF